MTRKSKLPTTSTPSALNPLFGPPPLLEGEDSAAYDELLTRVSGDVKPADIIEEIWVRDVVDLTWESFRWRRIEMSLLAGAMPAELEDFLTPLFRKQPEAEEQMGGYPELLLDFTPKPPPPERKLAKNLVKDWAARDPAAIERVAKLMASANITWTKVMAGVFEKKFDTIDRIDRSIMTSEARRNGILREIDRRRSNFAQTLRHSLQDVEEAEFKIVEAKKLEPKTRVRRTRHDQQA